MMSRSRNALVPFTLLASLAGCLDEEAVPDLASEDSALTWVQKRFAMRGTLEAIPQPGLPVAAELDMPAGRLSRIPVSWFFAGKATHSGTTGSIKVRARCNYGATIDQCNPALVVTYRYCTASCSTTPVWSATYAFANQDTLFTTPQGFSFDTTVSITPNASSTRHEITAYAYSENRSTSLVTVDWCASASCAFNTTTGWSAAWTNPKTSVATSCNLCNVGGTTVYAGRLQANDGLKIRTPGWLYGNSNQATDLVTFSSALEATGTGTAGGAFWSDRHYCGPDCGYDEPAIFYPTGSSSQVIALLGKDAIGAGNSGLEIFADLIRHPLSSAETAVAMSCTGSTCTGNSTTLGVGRYYVKVKGYTSPNQGFAELTTGQPSTYHLADDGHSGCPQDSSDPTRYARGRGNERALTIRVTKNGTQQLRDIPLAAFGGGVNDWQTFIVEIDNDSPSNTWRVDVLNKASGVNLQSNWFWTRNPDAAELRLATLNTHKEREQAHKDSIARLLAGRGRYDTVNSRIVSHPLQDPFEWQADVIALQELEYSEEGQSFLDAFTPWTNSGWGRATGKTEDFTFSSNNGAVYVRDYFHLASTGAPPYNVTMNQAALLDAGCNSSASGSGGNTYSCPAGYCIDCAGTPAVGDAYLRSVPARTYVHRRGGSASARPVAVFNTHLMTDQWGTEYNTRRAGIDFLITEIQALTADPRTAPSFTSHSSGFGPMNSGNRFVIIGDFNMSSNRCGEFAWFVRKLRQSFGYAVDASSAYVDQLGRTQDAHYSGTPLSSGFAGTFAACNGSNVKAISPNGNIECPYHWVHRDYFLNNVTQLTYSQGTWDGWFPWWATTTHNENDGWKTHGERLDGMILVGRGWAEDDPVVGYKVMPNRTAANPGNSLDGGGVRMHGDGDDDACTLDYPGVVPYNDPTMYNPTCGGQPTAGMIAIHSDHRPVGARLRVVGR